MNVAQEPKITNILRDLPRRLLAGRLSRNGLFALGHGVVLTLCVFLTYRIVISNAGLEWFGIWSLLLAATTVMRIFDISGCDAMFRFVAMASKEADPFRAREYLHTAITTGLVINTIIGALLWLLAPSALPFFISSDHLDEAQALVPWVIAIMLLSALAYSMISGLDGAQRSDHRAIVGATAAIALLLAGWVLVPRLGIVGLAAAQVLQQLVMLFFGWLMLRRHVQGLGWLPNRWRREMFVDITRYTVKFNAVGVMGLLFEPLAKFSFNHAGGPALVALFELASRLVTQFRMLLITAAAPLSPAFAARSGFDDPGSRRTLEKAMKVAVLAAIGMTLAALVAAPVASLILLDRISPELLKMNAALTAGWAINTLALPLFFAAQGLGQLRWNFVSNALIALSTLVGAFLLAPIFGSMGIILAIVLGLIASTFALLFGNAYTLGATQVVWRLGWWLLGAGIAMAILSALAWTAAGFAGI